jgi:hypothetical protein
MRGRRPAAGGGVAATEAVFALAAGAAGFGAKAGASRTLALSFCSMPFCSLSTRDSSRRCRAPSSNACGCAGAACSFAWGGAGTKSGFAAGTTTFFSFCGRASGSARWGAASCICGAGEGGADADGTTFAAAGGDE